MNRPTVTDDMVYEACLSVAHKLDGADDDRQIETMARSIARVYRHPMDGFCLAKELDRREFWDTSREEADELDAVEMMVSRSLHAAEKDWFEANAIQPPLPVGAMTTRGVIAGIYEHKPAYYLVKENGCTQDGRHLLIKFEDAREAA